MSILGLAIQNHFKAIDLKMGRTGKHSKHRQSLVTLSRRHSMVQMLENLELDGPNPVRIHHPPTNHPLPAPISTSAKVIFVKYFIDDRNLIIFIFNALLDVKTCFLRRFGTIIV